MEKFKKYFFYAVIIGLTMGVMLNLMVRVEPSVSSFTAGISGIIVGFIICKIIARLSHEEVPKPEPGEMSLSLGFAPYFILILLVLGIILPPASREWANNTLVISFPFPKVQTNLGFITEMTKGHSPLKLLSHPGSYIIVCTVLSSLIYMTKKLWSKGMWTSVLSSCVKQAVPGTIALSAMIMMSFIMLESGMTDLLAQGTASSTKSLYPVFSSWIGVLGTFVTGSTTTSNVLFFCFPKKYCNINWSFTLDYPGCSDIRSSNG